MDNHSSTPVQKELDYLKDLKIHVNSSYPYSQIEGLFPHLLEYIKEKSKKKKTLVACFILSPEYRYSPEIGLTRTSNGTSSWPRDISHETEEPICRLSLVSIVSYSNTIHSQCVLSLKYIYFSDAMYHGSTTTTMNAEIHPLTCPTTPKMRIMTMTNPRDDEQQQGCFVY